MRKWAVVSVLVLAIGLVSCQDDPAQGKEDDNAELDLPDFLGEDFVKDLSDMVKKIAGPFVKAAEVYKDEKPGFTDHDVEYQTIDGEQVKVETSVKKSMVNGTEITEIKKKMENEDGKDVGVGEIKAIIASKDNDDDQDKKDAQNEEEG